MVSSLSCCPKVSYILFILFCILGCIFQIEQISIQYFAYKTTTRVEAQLQDRVRYPTLILCFRINELIESSELLHQYNNNNLSIQEIFDATPSSYESLHECFHRISPINDYKAYEPKECIKHFSMNKFYTGNQVCYGYHPHPSLYYNHTSVTNALSFNMHLYRIILSERFNDVKVIYIISDVQNTYHLISQNNVKANFPTLSRIFGKLLRRSVDQNWILVRNTFDNVTLLPEPYDTKCLEDGYVYGCYKNCLTKLVVSQLNRFPYTEVADDESSYLEYIPLSRHDIEHNRTIRYEYEGIADKCSQECYQMRSCIALTTSASADMYHNPQGRKNILVTISTASSANKHLFSIADMTLVAYISGSGGCVGIWFGISAVSVVSFFKSSKVWPSRNKWFRRHFRTIQKRIKRRIRMTLKHLFYFLYYIICVTGFLVQFATICETYFSYRTTSRVEMQTSDIYEYPNLAFCVEYLAVLNRSSYQKYGIDAKPGKNWMREMSMLSVGDIFELTPSIDTFLHQCYMRNSVRGGGLARRSCKENFQVSKVIQGEHVCYIARPNDNLTYSWSDAVSDISHQTQIYELAASLAFPKAPFSVITLYDSPQKLLYPTFSRYFSHKLSLVNPKITAENESIIIWSSSSTAKYETLPPPYDTMCFSSETYYDCRGICLRQLVMEKLGRAVDTAAVFNDSDTFALKMISFQDMENQTIYSNVMNIEKKCFEMCSRISCERSISYTSAKVHYDDSEFKHLRIQARVPSSPTIHISSKVILTFTEYVQFVGNCVGTWFGLSVMALNPLRFKYFRRKTSDNLHNETTLQHKEQIRKRWRNWIRFLSLLFYSICFLGLLFQSISVSLFFFKYQTTTRLELTTSDQHRYPSLVFCSRYWDLIEESNNMTVKNILDMTPQVNDTIDSCEMRLDGQLLSKRDKSICLDILYVMKYVAGEDVCYSFIPDMDYSLRRVTATLDEISVIYKLSLNRLFSKTRYSFTVSYILLSAYLQKYSPRYWVPIRARVYGTKLFRTSHSWNEVVVQNTLHNLTLLPAPYDTNCVNDETLAFCFANCSISHIKSGVKKVPFWEMITEPEDFSIISNEDIQNEAIEKFIKHTDEYCSSMCSHYQICNSYYTLTDATPFVVEENEDNIVLVAATPKSNGLIVNTLPFITLIEYINYLCVAESIWLGVSVLSLYPLKYLQKRRRRRRIEQLRIQAEETKMTTSRTLFIHVSRVPNDR